MLLSQIDLGDLSHSVNGNRMAGRVSLSEAPNRPSPKNDTLILHFDADVKSLVDAGKLEFLAEVFIFTLNYPNFLTINYRKN
jgi:hypothetical protein